MMHHDDSWWWCVMMMHDDDASWWCFMMHHDDASRWCFMMHHDDASWTSSWNRSHIGFQTSRLVQLISWLRNRILHGTWSQNRWNMREGSSGMVVRSSPPPTPPPRGWPWSQLWIKKHPLTRVATIPLMYIVLLDWRFLLSLVHASETLIPVFPNHWIQWFGKWLQNSFMQPKVASEWRQSGFKMASN